MHIPINAGKFVSATIAGGFNNILNFKNYIYKYLNEHNLWISKIYLVLSEHSECIKNCC